VLTESLIVFTTPRSGSTLLCDWLRAFLPTHLHLFEPNVKDILRFNLLFGITRQNNVENSVQRQDLLNLEKHRPLVIKAWPSETGLLSLLSGRKVILLDRRDIRKQCLSNIIALKTKIFNSNVANLAADLLLTDADEIEQRLIHQLILIKNFDNLIKIRDKINLGTVICQLDYEDFENDLNNLFVALQPVLGLTEEHRKLIPNNYVKQNINHESKIANIELFNDLWEKHKHISGRY
jgi:hypothetical protein